MSPRSFSASSGRETSKSRRSVGLDADLDVVVIDKDRDIQFFLHSIPCVRRLALRGARCWSVQSLAGTEARAAHSISAVFYFMVSRKFPVLAST